MTTRQIHLVQKTFEMILPIADTVAFLFYEHFFTLAPSVRPMFPTDMAAQRIKLVETLMLMVRGLDRPAELVAYLGELGERHRGYHVRPAHYAAMNQAIVDTLAECLGERFTPEMRTAWEESLAALAAVMQGGPESASTRDFLAWEMA